MNVMRRTAAIALGLSAALGLTATDTQAAVITGGTTDVVLTSAGALAGAGVGVKPLGTGTIEATRPFPTAVFPITGGSIGAGGATIEHQGSGLELSSIATPAKKIDVTNFLVDTAAGLVSGDVNGGTTAIGLFSLQPPTGLNMIPLNLTAGAAQALNGLFGTSFTTATQIGVASTHPTTGAVPEPSTWALMGLGFAALGFAGFRKARPAATGA